MARTKTLAKAVAQAPAPSDNTPPPVRALLLRIDAPRPERVPPSSDYAYVTFEFSVALIAADGSEKADGHYKARSRTPDAPDASDVSTFWAQWPHAPAWGEGNVAFRYGFNAKAADRTDRTAPTFPQINLTGYEPALEQAAAGVAFGTRTLKALRMLDDVHGPAASFPEALSRLMQATECTAVATHREDYESYTGKPTPPHRVHLTYRMAKGVPEARMMAEEALAVAMTRYQADKEESDSDPSDPSDPSDAGDPSDPSDPT